MVWHLGWKLMTLKTSFIASEQRERKWSLAAADTKKDRSLSKAEGKIVTDCDLNSQQ